MEYLKLFQLLRLASPCLPIGGYTYSQGLENAIDTSAVHDSGSALAWIRSVLQSTQTNFECAAVAMAYRFLEGQDEIALIDLNMRLLTSRVAISLERRVSWRFMAWLCRVLAPRDVRGRQAVVGARYYGCRALGPSR